MANKFTDKRCPQCSGEIDFFGSCRKCGREWSESLEDEEKSVGLPTGEEHPSIIKTPKKPRKPNSKIKNAKSEPKYSNWMISESDDETEIIRKRSLMRLDSKRSYSALGLISRAYDTQRGTLLWLKHLTEFLDEEEREALAPTFEILKRVFSDITRLKQIKAFNVAEMEIALEKAHASARKVRLIAGKNIKPGEDTEGFSVPEPVALNPQNFEDPKLLSKLTKEELLDLAKTRLANLDQEKALRKRETDEK